MTELGRVEEVDLRPVFKSEPHGFTPWLAGYLDQLSERLGIEVVDPEVEKRVRDFWLDILGSDVNTRQIVAIENRLESSDHTHLGQLITYASGVEAGIVVWITLDLRMEHQQALDWLNENSDTSFFGVELRAIRIGVSEPAVDFRVRVAPNDWRRGVRKLTSSGGTSPRNEFYRRFFDELSTRYWENHPERRKPKAQPQNWYAFGAGKCGFTFGWAFNTRKRLSTEFYIDTEVSSEVNVEYLRELKEVAGEAPEGLDHLNWEELPKARVGRIAEYTSGDIEAASTNERSKEKLMAWAVDRMGNFESVFAQPIKDLSRLIRSWRVDGVMHARYREP